MTPEILGLLIVLVVVGGFMLIVKFDNHQREIGELEKQHARELEDAEQWVRDLEQTIIALRQRLAKYEEPNDLFWP